MFPNEYGNSCLVCRNTNLKQYNSLYKYKFENNIINCLLFKYERKTL